MGLTGLGVVADLLAIGGALVAIFKVAQKWVAWIRQGRHTSIADYTASRKIRFRTAAEELRRSQIAIVDDEPASFPVDHLRAVSGHVEVFEKLDLANVSVLERFDIVFLDISGVVPEDPRNGGIEVLKRLRSDTKLDPLVIAVSSKTFKPEVNRFFSLADDVLSKPLKAALTEDALLDLLQEKRTVAGLARQCDELVAASKPSMRAAKSIVRSVVRYVEATRPDTAGVRKSLHKAHVGSADKFIGLVARLREQIYAA